MVEHPDKPLVQEYGCGTLWNLLMSNGPIMRTKVSGRSPHETPSSMRSPLLVVAQLPAATRPFPLASPTRWLACDRWSTKAACRPSAPRCGLSLP